MCVLERSLWLRVEENGVEAGRQGRGCGQSQEKMTVARPEPWQQQWGDLKVRIPGTRDQGPGCMSGAGKKRNLGLPNLGWGTHLDGVALLGQNRAQESKWGGENLTPPIQPDTTEFM